MKGIHVTSEITPLKKVLLHRPGKELLNLTPDTLHEINQLYFLCYLIHTSNIESIVIAYNLLDKTRFSHTSAPIHSDEFRLI